MVAIQKLVLDVLKPHAPSSLELAKALAGQGPGYKVYLDVEEVDEKTETVLITIEGSNLDFERIEETIQNLGGSLHSVDQILVENRISN